MEAAGTPRGRGWGLLRAPSQRDLLAPLLECAQRGVPEGGCGSPPTSSKRTRAPRDGRSGVRGTIRRRTERTPSSVRGTLRLQLWLHPNSFRRPPMPKGATGGAAEGGGGRWAPPDADLEARKVPRPQYRERGSHYPARAAAHGDGGCGGGPQAPRRQAAARERASIAQLCLCCAFSSAVASPLGPVPFHLSSMMTRSAGPRCCEERAPGGPAAAGARGCCPGPLIAGPRHAGRAGAGPATDLIGGPASAVCHSLSGRGGVCCRRPALPGCPCPKWLGACRCTSCLSRNLGPRVRARLVSHPTHIVTSSHSIRWFRPQPWLLNI